MIWHIFKKDWKLLWIPAAIVGVLHLALNIALLWMGRFGGTYLFRLRIGVQGAERVIGYLPEVVLLAGAFLIATIVHQDAIPGQRQDWLVRPIRRRDLLLAKLLGVVILVQGPIFLAALIEVLLAGFPIGQSALTALGRCTNLFFTFALPVFAFASLTRNLMEAIVGGVAIVVGEQLLGLFTGRGFVDYYVLWVNVTGRLALLLIGAGTLLAVQYYWRKTNLSRWLLAGFLCLATLMPGLSFQSAFALQRRLSPNPGAGNSIAVNFVPIHEALQGRAEGPQYRPASNGDVFVLLPVQLTGVPQPARIQANESRARLIAADGRTYDLPSQMGFQIWHEQKGEGEKPLTYGIRVPAAIYRSVADSAVRVEVDFSLTMLGLKETQVLPATGGDQRSKALGWCGTRIEDGGLQVLYGCFQAGEIPQCTSAVLEDPSSGTRNPRASFCRNDFSPYAVQYGSDALNRMMLTLPIGDPTLEDPYPVKSSNLANAQVTVRAYEVQEHFTRQLVIPEIKLREWAAE